MFTLLYSTFSRSRILCFVSRILDLSSARRHSKVDQLAVLTTEAERTLEPITTMVNAGRVACIATPFALTIGALICLILVFLGGSIEKSSTLDSLYFAKVRLLGPARYPITN